MQFGLTCALVGLLPPTATDWRLSMRDRAKSRFNEVVYNGTTTITKGNEGTVWFDRATGITTVSRKLFNRYDAKASGDSYGVTVTVNNIVVAELPFSTSVLMTFNRWIKTVNKVDLFDKTGGGLSYDSNDKLANALASSWRLFI